MSDAGRPDPWRRPTRQERRQRAAASRAQYGGAPRSPTGPANTPRAPGPGAATPPGTTDAPTANRPADASRAPGATQPTGAPAPPAPAWREIDPAAHKPGFQPGDLLLILLGLALALLILPQFYVAFQVLFLGETVDTGQLRAIDLWINAAVLLAVFGALPFLWVLATRNEPWEGTVAYLRLHDPWRSMLWGLGLGIALILVLVVLGLVLEALEAAPENPAVETLSGLMSWPLALFLSFAAAVGEEVLFRGVIQRWIGVWGQAAVFAALHAYQGMYGIALTFLLALLFGFMVKRGGSLWIAIAAHFTFDIIQMVALMYAPEAA